VFVAGAVALAGASAFDWKTTSDLIHRGGHEINSAWAIGRRPTDSRIAAYGATYTGAELAAFHWTEKSKRWWIRWAGRGYVAWATEEHIRLGFSNRRIR
jgi:hypothetical protein